VAVTARSGVQVAYIPVTYGSKSNNRLVKDHLPLLMLQICVPMEVMEIF